MSGCSTFSSLFFRRFSLSLRLRLSFLRFDVWLVVNFLFDRGKGIENCES